jgi:hypothetical protein
MSHIASRHASAGRSEAQYCLLVVVEKGKEFRVYVNAPGKRKKSLERKALPRSRFPRALFE